jgi:rubrerythrin
MGFPLTTPSTFITFKHRLRIPGNFAFGICDRESEQERSICMSDELFMGLNRVKNPSAKTDLEKKHVPTIHAPVQVKAREPFEVKVAVGEELAHPDEPARCVGRHARTESRIMNNEKLIPDNMTPAETLTIAIRSEVEAKQIYHRASAKVVNESLKGRLDFLEQEEDMHRRVLEEVYHKKFPDIDLVLPDASILPRMDIAVSEDSTVMDLLEVAMEWERLSGEFYEKLVEKTTDHGSRAILISLSAAEWGHFHLIKSEYDLVKAFPSYAHTKDFNPGEDALHIGP